jgi:hypothetical protein
MSNLIVLSNQEKQENPALNLLFNIPIGFMDPNHPGVSVKAQKAILRDRYHDKLIADGLETGNFKLNQDGSVNFKTKLQQYTFAGFIFEALAVRLFNDNMRTIGRNAFEWCTNQVRMKNDSNDYFDQFKAIGTGFISTKEQHLDFYHHGDNRFDIKFIRKNHAIDLYEPAIVLDSTRDAGIQVKAITGNEKTKIID